MSARLPDWEARLLALLDEAAARPFELGRWDCALFGGAAVLAVTGNDIARPYIGKYTTAAGYMRQLKRRGHKDIFGPFDKIAERTGRLACGRGDIVSDGTSIGVMWHGHALFVGGAAGDAGAYQVGLVRVPMAALQWGWRL